MKLTRPLVAALACATLTLTGCSVSVGRPSDAVPTDAPVRPATDRPTPSASATPLVDATVPGYAPGQFPAVPLFSVPDVSVLDTAGTKLRDHMKAELPDVPGVTIKPVQCGADGAYVNAERGLVLYGDGSGSHVGPDGAYSRDAAGAEVASDDEGTIVRDGRGGGVYSGRGVSIVNNGDGSGTYSGAGVSLTLDGKGGGTYSSDAESITNNGDGSGTYSNGLTSTTNNGDGSGTWSDGRISIANDGKGSAVVSSAGFSGEVAAEKLPPVPKLGKFPPVEQLLPTKGACGFVITLDAGVLFDFDKSDVRPDAASVLDDLTKALTGIDSKDIQVSGHTDAIGTDAYNQGLSERRAASVVSALQQRGVSAPMTSKGFGESKPVAPNEVDGVDNPAGRQLNRRVEIFVRA